MPKSLTICRENRKTQFCLHVFVNNFSGLIFCNFLNGFERDIKILGLSTNTERKKRFFTFLHFLRALKLNVLEMAEKEKTSL
jgi:hypothetical protein